MTNGEIEDIPLEYDVNQNIQYTMLFAHQKMVGLVEDIKIFFDEIGVFEEDSLLVWIFFVALFIGVIEAFWWRKKRQNHQGGYCQHEEEKAKTILREDFIAGRLRVVEAAEDLEEIRSSLQNELNLSVERKVEEVRQKINSRKEEMQQRLAAAEVGSNNVQNFGLFIKIFFLLRLPWSRSWRWYVPSARPRRRR